MDWYQEVRRRVGIRASRVRRVTTSVNAVAVSRTSLQLRRNDVPLARARCGNGRVATSHPAHAMYSASCMDGNADVGGMTWAAWSHTARRTNLHGTLASGTRAAKKTRAAARRPRVRSRRTKGSARWVLTPNAP